MKTQLCVIMCVCVCVCVCVCQQTTPLLPVTVSKQPSQWAIVWILVLHWTYSKSVEGFWNQPALSSLLKSEIKLMRS